jgi:nitric oxide synthase oxygenase domain/subunit
VEQFHAETHPAMTVARRMRQVLLEINATGTYTHTPDELTFGARVAWRNAARCIGRLYWCSLRVRDLRHLLTPAEIVPPVSTVRVRPGGCPPPHRRSGSAAPLDAGRIGSLS